MGRFTGVLLVSDYDNTLVDSEGARHHDGRPPQVSERNREALEFFMGQGGRFALATTAALDDAPTAVADVYVTLTGRTATVCSTAEPIGALMLTAADGRTLARRAGIGANETSVQLRGGVQVLTVTLEDGTQRTFKLLAR